MGSAELSRVPEYLPTSLTITIHTTNSTRDRQCRLGIAGSQSVGNFPEESPWKVLRISKLESFPSRKRTMCFQQKLSTGQFLQAGHTALLINYSHKLSNMTEIRTRNESCSLPFRLNSMALNSLGRPYQRNYLLLMCRHLREVPACSLPRGFRLHWPAWLLCRAESVLTR